MERLTYRDSTIWAHAEMDCRIFEDTDENDNECYSGELIDRLAAYEDIQEKCGYDIGEAVHNLSSEILRLKDELQYVHSERDLWEREAKKQASQLGEAMILKKSNEEKLFNPIGEYACKFAENHGITMSEAMEHQTVKAFAECFNSGLINSATK